MVFLLGIVFLVGVIAGIVITLGKCNHEWETIDTGYSENAFYEKFKVFTLRCSKCGKIKVQKFKIN